MRNHWTRLFLFAFVFGAVAYAKEPLAIAPFVGCPADGQQGPVAPPKAPPKQLPIPQSAAEHLAWYQTAEEGGRLGVLAPRGWHCFGTYGSSGSAIYVAPEPLNADKLIFQRNWRGFTGPAVGFSISIGDTSGRFEVARVIARVFPAHRDFLRSVIAEKLEPASDFPTGPFPADRLTYKSKDLVEFTTAPRQKGLGTMSWLLPSDQPISGIATLTGEENSLSYLGVRLPPSLAQLGPVIIRQTEHDLSRP